VLSAWLEIGGRVTDAATVMSANEDMQNMMKQEVQENEELDDSETMADCGAIWPIEYPSKIHQKSISLFESRVLCFSPKSNQCSHG
jgi:hypothetical protein